MSYSVVLLLTDIMIIGSISALIVAAAIFLARKEDRERALSLPGELLSVTQLESPTSSSDRRSPPPLPAS
jgi:hypothetical protein